MPDSRRVAARIAGLDEAGLAGHRGAVAALVRLDDAGSDFTPTAAFEVGLGGGTVQVEIDTSGAIDVAAEACWLTRDLAAARKELDQADKKLSNPKFVEKAPADVVEGIRSRRGAAAADIDRIEARLEALPAS